MHALIVCIGFAYANVRNMDLDMDMDMDMDMLNISFFLVFHRRSEKMQSRILKGPINRALERVL